MVAIRRVGSGGLDDVSGVWNALHTDVTGLSE